MQRLVSSAFCLVFVALSALSAPAHAQVMPRWPGKLGPMSGRANQQYIGVSWLGSFGEDEVAYAFTKESLWDAQLPADFSLRAPTPPPQSVRIPVNAPGASGEIAMGVVHILEDLTGDGQLAYTYADINSPTGPVRATARDYFIFYVHNLNDAARQALDLPYAGQLQEGFNLILGSASVSGIAGCPDHAQVVYERTAMRITPREDPSPVCWGGQ